MLTQTSPCPPPGAGVALVAAVDAFVVLPGVGLVFGLNREPIAETGFPGVAEAAGVGDDAAVVFLLVRCSAGDGAGLDDGLASAFLRERALLGDGEAELSAAGEGLASAFLRCLAGEEDAPGDALGAGDCAFIAQAPAKAINDNRVISLEAMEGKLRERSKN